MILQVYAIKDELTAFKSPFFMQTERDALALFTAGVNDDSLPMRSSPQDFSLYHLGEWSDSTGLFIAAEPIRVATANEVLIRKEE